MSTDTNELIEITEFIADLKIELIAAYIFTLIIFGIFVWIYGRIKKSADLYEVNLNFKHVLQNQIDLKNETEKIKQRFDQENLSYQIKLAAYHDKSISALNEIYLKLIDFRDAVRKVAYTNEGWHAQEFKDYQAEVALFEHAFDINKPWISLEIKELIENTVGDIQKRTAKFVAANETLKSPNLSQQALHENFDGTLEFTSFIIKNIDKTFDDLAEFISKQVNVN